MVYSARLMNDIKIPSDSQKSTEFSVKSMHQQAEKHQPVAVAEPSDKIKVKFEKFVQLVATHDFEGVLKKYADDDIILSSNLLTDLASAHEEVEAPVNRMPIWVVSGIIIGIIVTYLILRF